MNVSVPGKLMLLGEYAVLEDAPALVAAVNRRAEGRRFNTGRSESPVVRAVRAAVEADQGPKRFGIDIDTRGFRDAANTKLGIGSSAATAVAAAALFSGAGDERTFGFALEGHRASAGGKGSGVDVAACFHGGVISTRVQPAPVRPLATRVSGLQMCVLGTGEAASTSEFVSRCRSSDRWAHWCKVLTALAEEGIEAYGSGDRLRFLSAVARYGRAMKGLGTDAGVPVVTDRLEAVAKTAAALGGAAKPSGAGGGDVAVAWLPTDASAQELAKRTGTSLVDLAVDPKGLVVRG